MPEISCLGDAVHCVFHCSLLFSLCCCVNCFSEAITHAYNQLIPMGALAIVTVVRRVTSKYSAGLLNA